MYLADQSPVTLQFPDDAVDRGYGEAELFCKLVLTSLRILGNEAKDL